VRTQKEGPHPRAFFTIYFSINFAPGFSILFHQHESAGRVGRPTRAVNGFDRTFRRPLIGTSNFPLRGVGTETTAQSVQVEAVQIHHLRPRSDEIMHELGRSTFTRIDFGNGSKLGVRAKY
jgi:hypothetical protein